MDVLLIEDDEDTGDALAMLFDLWGIRFQWARSGREAVARMQDPEVSERHAPDVILLDLKLPDMSGERLVHELQRFREVPPVVLYSASSLHELEDAARSIDAKAVLRKPADGSEIVATLRSAAHGEPVPVRHRGR